MISRRQEFSFIHPDLSLKGQDGLYRNGNIHDSLEVQSNPTKVPK